MGNTKSIEESRPATNGYDWKPDYPDTRDVYFRYNKLTNSQKQLEIVDLRGRFAIGCDRNYPTSTSNCVAMVLGYFGQQFDMPGGVCSIRDCCKLVNLADPAKKLVYERIQNTLPQMKRSLIEGCPIITGLTIYDTTDLKANEIAMPDEKSNIVGGICVAICGFNMETEQWLVKVGCSDSGSVGDHGYLYVPFKYFEKEGEGDYWRLSIGDNVAKIENQ